MSEKKKQSDYKPKKESILDLSKYQDKQIRVKFSGGRTLVGTLKGYDQLMNLVLEDVSEFMRDLNDPSSFSGKTRKLPLLVCRGTTVTSICPEQGTEIVENPF